MQEQGSSLCSGAELNFSSLWLLLFPPSGGRHWGKSAPGDGERLDGSGQGRGARLCLAGEPQQRGSLHREPPPALQGKPNLCNAASFLHNIFTKQVQLVCWDLNVFSGLAQTYIGSVLVSVNPYKELEIYSKQQMERYRGVSFYEISPHMWVASHTLSHFSLQLFHCQQLMWNQIIWLLTYM